MKVKVISLMLMVIIGISLMACGDVSAKSDSGIFEPIDSTMPEVTEYGPIEGVPAGAEFVARSEAITEVEVTESTAEVDITEVDPADAEGEEYTGSLYTLPVAKKGEEWSEAQLDEYLASSKAFKKAYDGETFDFDTFMKVLGFEYVSTIEDGKIVANQYYYERGKYKIMCFPVHADRVFYIYVDNGIESIYIEEYYMGYDGDITIQCSGMPKDKMKNGFSPAMVKGVAASLDYLVHSKNKDCARLPYYTEYSLSYGGEGSFLYREYNPLDVKLKVVNRENPYLH